jgi:hypothetical protein
VPKLQVTNETSAMQCMFVEPWGTDHWLLPGQTLTVVTEQDLDEAPFSVVVHDQGISVVCETAYSATVHDAFGEAPCGYQRPDNPGW